jgi:hypothetical protein
VAGVDAARAHAQAVLRIRGIALAAAALPAAVAVVLLAGRVTGRLGAPGSPDAAAWDAARWVAAGLAVLVLLVVAAVAGIFSGARPLRTPAVPVSRQDAPELHRLVRDLAARMEVPAPSGIALIPDCDAWLEECEAPDADRPRGLRALLPGLLGRPRPEPPAPVLVIGSPFLWWMRVSELRALLAPVVAGTGAAADPDIAAARRFVRGLDAAGAAVRRGRSSGRGHEPEAGHPGAETGAGAVKGAVKGATAGTRAASPLARPVIVVLDRITRALLTACRGHAAELERAIAVWASRQAQVVDHGLRLAAQEQVGLAYAGWDRLLTRVALPAWRIRRLPAQLNAGVVAALTELSRRDRLAEGFEQRLGDRPACDLLEEPGAVDEAASLLAAQLFHGIPDAGSAAPGWSLVCWNDYPDDVVDRIWRSQAAALHAALDRIAPPDPADGPAEDPADGLPGIGTGPTVARVLQRLRAGDADRLTAALTARLALDAEPARPYDPLVLPQPPRTGRDLLADHVTAMVCCAAVDTAGAVPGLDWLDGPTLLVRGIRRADLAASVARAVEHSDDGPLRDWLEAVGVRLEKPVRLA